MNSAKFSGCTVCIGLALDYDPEIGFGNFLLSLALVLIVSTPMQTSRTHSVRLRKTQAAMLRSIPRICSCSRE